MKRIVVLLLMVAAVEACVKKDIPPDIDVPPVLYVSGFYFNTPFKYTIGTDSIIGIPHEEGGASVFTVLNAANSMRIMDFYFYDLHDTGKVSFKNLEKIQASSSYDYKHYGSTDSSINVKIVWYSGYGKDTFSTDLVQQKEELYVKEVKTVYAENKKYRQISLSTSCKLMNRSNEEVPLNEITAVIALSAEE